MLRLCAYVLIIRCRLFCIPRYAIIPLYCIPDSLSAQIHVFCIYLIFV